jgi:hypothetical protein
MLALALITATPGSVHPAVMIVTGLCLLGVAAWGWKQRTRQS